MAFGRRDRIGDGNFVCRTQASGQRSLWPITWTLNSPLAKFIASLHAHFKLRIRPVPSTHFMIEVPTASLQHCTECNQHSVECTRNHLFARTKSLTTPVNDHAMLCTAQLLTALVFRQR
jgi:hypothetical protein